MESTLSLTLQQLQSEVGTYLGYGQGANYNDTPWTAFQLNRIESCVASGIRQFLYPPPLPGEKASYDWTFLKPTTTLTLPAGTKILPLPDDFGGFEGEITLFSPTSQIWWPVRLMNEGQVRQAYTLTPQMSGRPQFAALQPLKGTTATAGQRWQLFIFPNADTTYQLQFQFYLLPDYLSVAFPFPLAGMSHAETILESCLAVAEQRLDDSSTTHAQQFLVRLAASVNQDRRHKAQTLGPNYDRSDGLGWNRRWTHYDDRITFNGVMY